MPWHAKVQTPTKKNWYEKCPSRPASDGPTAGTDLPSWNGQQAIDPNLHVQAGGGGGGGGNKFSGGVHIFQKNSFRGGMNLKGVQIKRDRPYTK